MTIRHILYEENPGHKYRVAILIKDLSFNAQEIEKYYIAPLEQMGLDRKDIVVFNLEYTPGNKAPVGLMKEHLSSLLPALEGIGVEYLLVADPNYFKLLTKVKKADPHYGYVLRNEHSEFPFKIILSTNYAALFYNPELRKKLDISLRTLTESINSIHVEPGKNILHYSEYVTDLAEIPSILRRLKEYPELTVDIETYSLDFWKTEIATIGFAWSKHEGICIDLNFVNTYTEYSAFARWFEEYTGTTIYHGATFDVKMLIYHLFMEKDPLNYEGLVHGIEVMFKDTHCTKIISYLATNSTAGKDLSLKGQSQEYMGNYAVEEIEDISVLTQKECMEYNLKDCIATWYVMEKNFPVLLKDSQLGVYETIMRPSMAVVTQMELVGMPLDEEKVEIAYQKLSETREGLETFLRDQPHINLFQELLREEAAYKANQKLKKLRKSGSDFQSLEYNPGSGPQNSKLLYDLWQLPVIDKTDKGNPATGAETLEKLLNQLKNEFDISDEELSLD